MKTYRLYIFIFIALLAFLSCSKKTTESDNTTVKTPRFLPASGTYEEGQYMSIQCGTEDAEIRYTVDMTEPNLSSPIYTQSLVMPDFFINNSNYCRIKAKAFRPDLLPSVTVNATYTINYENTVATPLITPASGTFDYSPITLTISCITPGAQIRFTDDGTEPNYTSFLYAVPIHLTGNKNIKAKAFKAGMNSSNIAATNITQRIYEVGYIQYSNSIIGLEVEGDYAYLADNEGFLRIIDISNLSTLEENGNIFLFGFPRAVKVRNNLAYVLTTSGLNIIDVSNPATPVSIGSTSGFAAGTDLALDGNYAYTSDFYDGLYIFDISNPESPTQVGHLDTTGMCRGIDISGNYAYVADMGPGIRIINITNPTAPVLVSTADTPGQAWSVKVSGNYAYVADTSSGLSIINISNPVAPLLVSNNDTSDICIAVDVSGNKAFCADGYVGLRIVDISNPANPAQLGYCGTEDSATDVKVVGSYAFVADQMGGMRIIYCGIGQ